MIKIDIPKKLDLESTLTFCSIISNLQEDTEYIYDYKDMMSVEPFGMLLMGSKIRWLVKKSKESRHMDRNFKGNEDAKTDAANMGYFQSVYQNYGKKLGEITENKNIIPIKYMNFDEMKKHKDDINSSIDNLAKTIVNMLASNANKDIKKCLQFSTSELLRNVFDHSESTYLWYTGQYWEDEDVVEIAILDEGIGIRQSLNKSSKVKINNDKEAILLALEAGISRTGIGKAGRGEYDNIGFGLYMISNICKVAGDIAICSGEKCIVISESGTVEYDTEFKGTAIRIRVKKEKLKDINSITIELSKKGDKIAKRYKGMKEVSLDSII